MMNILLLLVAGGTAFVLSVALIFKHFKTDHLDRPGNVKMFMSIILQQFYLEQKDYVRIACMYYSFGTVGNIHHIIYIKQKPKPQRILVQGYRTVP